MEELKPCPFCGSEAKMHAAFAHGIASRVGAYVECASCGAWSATHWGDDAQEKTAEAWNRRAERTCRWELVEGTLFATECGEAFHRVVPDDYCPNCGAKVMA